MQGFLRGDSRAATLGSPRADFRLLGRHPEGHRSPGRLEILQEGNPRRPGRVKILQEGNPRSPGRLGLTQLAAPPAVSLDTGRFCLQGSIIPAREKEISVPAAPRSIPSFTVLLLFVSVQDPCLEIWDAEWCVVLLESWKCHCVLWVWYRNPCACPA